MKSNSKETDRIKEPSKFAIKFANTLFVLGILFSVLVMVYAVYQNINHPEMSSTFYYLFFLFSVFTAILFGFGLRRLRDELKVNISVLLVAVVISVYGIETLLEYFHEKPLIHPESTIAIAKQMGVPFDARTKMEVLENLKDSSINKYSNFTPSQFIKSNGLASGDRRLFPLGGISKQTNVYRDQVGFWSIYKSDEHGFNNPKGLYKENKVDIILTGDSFTEGYSANSDENICAILRESGFNAINIGKGGNGPLIEFATLKEYAEPLKPKIVLWLYYVNDFDDLKNEMKSSLLKKYLDEQDFSLNLISRQEEIDSVLINYISEEWNREIEKQRVEKIINHWIIRVFKLSNLRNKINLTLKPEPEPKPEPKPEQLKIFKDILEKSKKMVSGWGGKMYFVYLPEFWRYSTGEEHINREFILHTVNEMMIPIIDIHKEVFDPHPDLLSLFPFRMYGHYNADGYRLVAEAISKRLKADGIIPLNSKN